MITLFRNYLFKNHYRVENIHTFSLKFLKTYKIHIQTQDKSYIYFLKIQTKLCKTLKNLIMFNLNFILIDMFTKKHHKDVSQDEKIHKNYLTCT